MSRQKGPRKMVLRSNSVSHSEEEIQLANSFGKIVPCSDNCSKKGRQCRNCKGRFCVPAHIGYCTCTQTVEIDPPSLDTVTTESPVYNVNLRPGIQRALGHDEEQREIVESAKRSAKNLIWDGSVDSLVTFLGCDVEDYLKRDYGNRKDLAECHDNYVDRVRSLFSSIFNFVCLKVTNRPLKDFSTLKGKSCILCRDADDATVGFEKLYHYIANYN